MYAYGSSHDQSYRSLPSLPPPWSLARRTPNTPIYDALYAEWADSFRSTPGDRSGEEEVVLAAFGGNPHSPYGAKSHHTHNSAGREGQWQRVAALGHHQTPRMQPSAGELLWAEAASLVPPTWPPPARSKVSPSTMTMMGRSDMSGV